MKKNSRRDFIKVTGLTTLVLYALPLSASMEEFDPMVDETEYLKVRSGFGRVTPHKHYLLIPYSVLENPPEEGFSTKTERGFFHQHEVVLTQSELQMIATGETLTKKWGGHNFAIKMPQFTGDSAN